VSSASYDGTVRMWDRQTGRLKRTMRPGQGRMYSVAYSPDGRRLALGDAQGQIFLMDAGTGQKVARLREHNGKVSSLTFSGDGKLLASAGSDGLIRLRDGTSGRELKSWETPKVPMSLSISPDSRSIAAAYYSGEIALYSWPGAQLVRSFQGHTHTVWGMAFSPDGDSLITTSADASVRRFPLADGTARILSRPGSPVYEGDLSPDGSLIGAPLADGRALLLGPDGAIKHTLRGHRGEVNSLSFAMGKDQPWAISTSDDGTVRLWNTGTGRPEWYTVLMMPELERVLTHRGWENMAGATIKADAPATRWATNARKAGKLGDISSRGTHLCLLTHEGKLELWDLKTDSRRFHVDEPGATLVMAAGRGCVVRSAQEARLYQGGGSYHKLSSRAAVLAAQEGAIIVASEDRAQVFDSQGQLKSEHKVGAGVTALGRSGPWLVAGFPEGSLELHTVGPDEVHPRHSFEGIPSSQVERIIQGPGDTVVVGFANGLVGLWERDTGSRLHAVRLHGPVVHLRLFKEKLYAASELGDHVTLDLGVFYKPYQALRAEVEKKVPVIWKEGQVQLAR
jgi:WD40 repeat protein